MNIIKHNNWKAIMMKYNIPNHQSIKLLEMLKNEKVVNLKT